MKNKRRKTKRKVAHEEFLDIALEKGIDHLVQFREDEPFEILGPHYYSSKNSIVIRAYLPRALEASVRRQGKKSSLVQMKRIHSHGIFQAVFENEKELFPYEFVYENSVGEECVAADPYSFPVDISGFDLHLLGEGNHFRNYDKLGAKPMVLNGTSGVHFGVWAPNAKSVSVVGDFNSWRYGAHPMMRVQFSGYWALFIPGLKEGDLYKFAVRGCDDAIRLKTDPYGFQAELRPQTACRVAALDQYCWNDSDWLERRSRGNPLQQPVSIYEVHLGSWRRKETAEGWHFLSYRELASELIPYVKDMGYSHIELLPIMEHPLDESWGYQVINFFAPTSRFGSPEDFMFFVDQCHQNGIGIIMDWVPGHFPKDAHGLSNFDGREIYGYESWKKREHKDWGTFVFDYGKNEVRNFLISNALFWFDKYHIDGLRVDAVASILYLNYSRKEGEWEPNIFGGVENLEAVNFLKRLNEIVHLQYPGVMTIAEESTAWPAVSRPTYLGGLGFSLKWNMGWMHDSLEYFGKDAIYRKWHQGTLTFSLIYAFSENFVLPFSHDEVVHGKGSLLEKMPGDDWQKFANMRLLLCYMFTHPGKKLLFMGIDMGQRSEWNCLKSLDWHLLRGGFHQNLKLLVKDLNHLYQSSPALYELDFQSEGFQWIDFSDSESSVISYMRWSPNRQELIVFACNMTPVARMNYRLGVQRPGFYREVLNSDAVEYGGSGVGNFGGIYADNFYAHGKPYSVNINLPPLGAVILKYEYKNEGNI